VLASSQPGPTTIAVDATDVYWSTRDSGAGDAKIMKCAISGCNGQPTVVVSAQSEIGGLAVDGASLYWTAFACGAVYRLPLH
jgi:hypothetical protein